MDDSTILPASGKIVNYSLFFLLYAWVLFSVSIPIAAQQIYKWADDDGNVHYSDRPDPNAQVEQIFIKPGPDSHSNEEPDETIKRLQATSNELEASRQRRETEREREQKKYRKALEESAKQEKEADKRETNRDRWYYGGFPQRPPTRQPNMPLLKPHPPMVAPLPSNVPAGTQ